MSVTDDQPTEIRAVSADRRADAFALVCSRLPVAQRQQQVAAWLAAVASGELSRQGLLGAYQSGRLVGAVLAQLQPGRTATVWVPRVVPDEAATIARQLLDAAADWLANHRVCVAQVHLPSERHADDGLLRAGGFDRLTDLLYLACAEDQFPSHLPTSPLQFEAYSVANHQRLARMVEATYEQTRDCPELDGVRETEDVLAGYRATGQFDPARWLIARHADEDVGCLLLADHAEHDNWELVYMGVAAAHRGHGWGLDIARHAQWLTRQAGRRRLVLAVDAENEPATRMYAAVGFRAWERRGVYLKVFGRSS
ncbi:MAG: GNAT family N-acetyltransferase [Pirellulales bacterium]|nr:GNAT family N-acetyltransferase [Pirellulales bacterium]